ncbi:unnamed protein product, partial [Ixodes persulcatus]
TGQGTAGVVADDIASRDEASRESSYTTPAESTEPSASFDTPPARFLNVCLFVYLNGEQATTVSFRFHFIY